MSHSHWLTETTDLCPTPTPLTGEKRVDVAILGGGFVGLWTALNLKALEPGLSVAVLERDRCGHGASGLNGGFVMSWWPKVASLRTVCGADDAVWLADQTTEAIRRFPETLAQHQIDAEYIPSGWLWTATSPRHIGAWTPVLQTTRALGREHIFQDLSAEQIAQRTGSKAHLAGIYEPLNGTVHPAKLALGLAAAARRLGVEVYEQSPALDIQRTRPAVVKTPNGSVTADTVIITTNAWAATVPELANAFVCVSSAVIATPEIPDRLAEIGWTGGESITDSQTTVDYYRTTKSGRIIFGKAAGQIMRKGPPGPAVFDDRNGMAAAERDFRRVYPMLADVPIERRWSGPIDRTYDGLPLLGTLPGSPHIHYGIGWSGNGVSPSQIGGRILAGLALNQKDRWTQNGLINRRPKAFPPEPLRHIGGNIVLRSVVRKDAAEIANQSPGWLDRTIATLAPSGLEDK